MSTIKLKIENLGVNKNKGQGWNAWIRAEDKTYYSKFCQDEEEGKAAIGSLQPGDTILLKYSVKNGFNNFQSYQNSSLDSTSDKKTETEEAEKKPVEQKKEQLTKTEEQRERAITAELKKEEQAKEKALNDFCVAHYTAAIDMAKEIVKSAKIDETDPLFVPVVTVILDKIATPKVYLKKEIL